MNGELESRIAVFPGSFDPFTRGHESIVKRGLQLFDRVVIGIGYNVDKHCLSSVEERVDELRKLYAAEDRVSVESYSGLTTDFAARQGALFVLRGVRSWRDFEYEQNMADVNRRLSGIETVVLFTEPSLACVSSSVVRELRHYGADVSEFLPTGEF
ncbi:MAG: pantetheine-phosphate adenylyltransferase [Clostridium sp.]|nr:pantetheine-phosphate adenylyltransferase [Clostridium sp.]